MIPVNNCLKCVNYLGQKGCLAYQKAGKIPDKIWYGDVPHTLPYKGDNGVQFEPEEIPK